MIFGAATAAYQIEGAWDEDGKGRSIWDDFVHQPGRIENGDTGDVACDHYHRYADDVALMAELGLQAYRFSVSWARVRPEGTGRFERRGLDFYDRLVDELLAHDIRPWLTLYHWDLPLALYERGGWEAPQCADWFAEYATAVAERLGDRVKDWMTLNEPEVVAFAGYASGRHAPGDHDPARAVRVSHGLMRAHAAGATALRAAVPDARIGIALNVSPVEPATDSEEDVAAARRVDGQLNRWFLDSVLGHGYPTDMKEWYRFDGEADLPPAPDFVGVNYYFRRIVRAADNFLGAEQIPVTGASISDMGWEIHPDGLREILARIRDEYDPSSLAVTENGIALEGIDDPGRVDYLRDHIARAEGLADAYFVWSLLDNFEWAWGCKMRFGIVHVDYETQKRTVKTSGRWYADRIKRG